MSKLFISYRRSDAEDATGRIYDRLIGRYGRKNVFKDVDSIPFSVDFRDYVKSSILSSQVTLVIIGRGWLNAQDEQGQRRLDNPEDFVRIEIETALSAPDMIVIPVLVGRGVMPPKGTLPPSLEKLIYRNASQVRPDPDFRDDLQELINGLDPYLRFQLAGRLKSLPKPAKQFGIAGLLVLLAGTGYWLINQNNAGKTELDDQKPDNTLTTSTLTADSTEEDEPADSPQSVSPLDSIIPYNPKFIGKRTIQLPDVTDQMSAGDRLDGKVFDYVHYSLMMDERRAMALYTAYNIDRTSMKRLARRSDRWLVDTRIPASLQTDDELYKNNDWDRGHMVSPGAVRWGDSLEAARAVRSTYFYSNLVPQHKVFNQRNWRDLEDFVLHKLRPESKHVTVFAGPVSRSTDYEYRGRRVPRSFWMIAVASDENNPLNFFVHAYQMDQYVLTANGVPTPIAPILNFDPLSYQVKVSDIEAVTPLQFGNIR